MPLTTNNLKVLIAVVGLMCVTFLLAIGRIDSTAGSGIIGMIVGYAVGNGVAAAQDKPVEPLISRKEPE